MKYLKLYESRETDEEDDVVESAIREIDKELLCEFWWNNYYEPFDVGWDDMISYFSADDLVSYVDEDSFYEHVIDIEVEDLLTGQSWQSLSFDRKKMMEYIKYVTGDEFTESDINAKSEMELKDTISVEFDKRDFIEWYLRDKYDEMSLLDMLSDLGFKGKTAFENGTYSILDYMDYGAMSDDYQQDHPFEIDYNEIVSDIVMRYRYCLYTQKFILDHDPSFIIDFVDKYDCAGLISKRNKDRNKYQSMYFNEIKKREIKKGRSFEKEIWKRAQKIIGNIDWKVAKEFDIETLVDGYEKGFIAK